ncbi:hypothetical protein [Limnohabitans sp. Jir72]|uniref:hypothetical protein n=1 Tax=Limnohabitans sp. Jir72 TaxID=1977909 RepID=UPI0011B1D16D|nr:hypothetical protein [Limnohabitans sp. Jir72]
MGELIGIDKFESVGDDPSRLVNYEMLDGNCMMFRREFGVIAAASYRETKHYDDDRRLYALLKSTAGARGKTHKASIEQTCPHALVKFFKENCSQV